MKRNMLNLIFAGALLIGVNSSVFAKLNYDPDQLKQFESTNQCPNCDLTGKSMYSENHNNANLAGALLTRSSIDSSQFSKANFAGANLVELSAEYTMMSGAIFTNANLSHANFNSANLSRADFSGAILTGADLANVTLIQAKITVDQLSEVSSLSCAIMPDGSRHAADPNRTCN